MIENLNIREYKVSDKNQLLEILKLNIPEYFAESELADLEAYLENNVEKYFVAEIDSQLVGGGGINFEKELKTAKISWDFIHPLQQGRGIGFNLLKHRLQILNAIEGIENIKVRTSQLAYKFYEKSGFVLQEVIPDYWAKGFDLYVMKYEK
ncbi:MAG: GNAT family N-acetyltransferase [Bacteroidia bacterium]